MTPQLMNILTKYGWYNYWRRLILLLSWHMIILNPWPCTWLAIYLPVLSMQAYMSCKTTLLIYSDWYCHLMTISNILVNEYWTIVDEKLTSSSHFVILCHFKSPVPQYKNTVVFSSKTTTAVNELVIIHL